MPNVNKLKATSVALYQIFIAMSRLQTNEFTETQLVEHLVHQQDFSVPLEQFFALRFQWLSYLLLTSSVLDPVPGKVFLARNVDAFDL